MPSLLKVYQDICRENLIRSGRQKDVKTALTYLAASYDSTPDILAMSESLEATYRQRMRTYFDDHPKGQSTIRNSIQAIGQFLKAAHQLTQTASIPLAPSPVPGVVDAIRHCNEHSPYARSGRLRALHYCLTPEQWPTDIAEWWQAYRLMRKDSLRGTTLKKYTSELGAFVSYLCLSPDERLAKLPEHLHEKLHLADFRDDLIEIKAPPVLTSWEELFQLSRIKSFITWQSWRVHTMEDAKDKKRKPSRPSTLGYSVAALMASIATAMKHKKSRELKAFRVKLPKPRKIHDKTAEYHRFEFRELEHVALALMSEARKMALGSHNKHPGAGAAIRFQTGLILALAWRNPMRARNWCEAILGRNLKKQDGRWRWRFEGDEIKIGQRRGTPNIFEPDVSPDVAPYLEEYLEHYRSRLPHATTEQHVFLSRYGNPLYPDKLLFTLRAHVYRYTGKRLYNHLLRSLFISHHLTNGVDINSVAFALNDTPATVLKSYNELMEEKHRPIIYEANQRALSHSNGHAWTPPNILLIPKPPKINPDQMTLI
jgi:hypothetical protein